MPCQFCGQPTTPSNQLLTKHGELHTGCLLAAYDSARDLVEAQAQSLDEARMDSIRLAIALNMAREEIENGGDKLASMVCNTALKLHRAALEGVEGQESEVRSQNEYKR